MKQKSEADKVGAGMDLQGKTATIADVRNTDEGQKIGADAELKSRGHDRQRDSD